MAEHMICVVAAQGCECATLCTISSAQAALGAMTDGEVATVLWRRHLYRRAPDMLTAEGKDHKEQLLKRGLWPPEGAESGE